MIKIVTRSAAETKKAARLLAGEIAARPGLGTRGALVITLSGELGAGKTTFTQGFAGALGIKEKIQSPTFVLMKIYGLPPRIKDKWKKIKDGGGKFRHLIHIDCYRIRGPQDLIHLGFKNLLRDRDAIILIEWPERIKKILPRDVTQLSLTHSRMLRERIIRIKKPI